MEFDEDKLTGVHQCALNQLAKREWGEQMLREKLLRWGNPPAYVEEVLARLKEAGLISEERYADYVYNKWLRKKYDGRRRLKLELKNKKVDPAQYKRILELLTDEVEEERALAYVAYLKRTGAEKFMGSKQQMEGYLGRALERKGFSCALIERVLGCTEN